MIRRPPSSTLFPSTTLSRSPPAATRAPQAAAVLARLTRASLLEVLPSDYVRTARAKGVASRRVLFHHALRNALIQSEEHTSELQSQSNIVCRLLLEKKNSKLSTSS